MISNLSPRLRKWQFAGPVGFLAIAAGSSLGLFGYPIGLYDDSALLLGAKILKRGGLPYTDFYTIYGPLSYSLLAPFLGIANPGVAYRAAQCVTLGALAVLMFFTCWFVFKNRLTAWVAAALWILSVSAALQLPAFLGFALTLLALGLFLLGSNRPAPRRAWVATACAGTGIGLLALVRPSLAVYSLLTFFLVLLLLEPLRSSAHAGTTLVAFALLSAASCWLIWYSKIPIGEFYAATVTVPAWQSRHSARLVPPHLVRWDISHSAQLVVAGATLAALYLAANGWVFAARVRSSRALISIGAAFAASIPLFLTQIARPSRISTPLFVLLVGIAGGAVVLGRSFLRESALLRASAACGLLSVSFLHYFWFRPDQVHFLPAVVLVTSATLLFCAAPTGSGRPLVIFSTLVAWLPFLTLPGGPFPIARLPVVLRQPLLESPSSEFSSDAAFAVQLADAGATSSSRFVAVASNHQTTNLSAVVLFLLSRRPPYTRWYTYDPGIQSSSFVQDLMIRDLQEAGSETAVVWGANLSTDRGASPTAFDRRFRAMYPSVVGRFGSYEVRRRGPNSP